MATGDTKSIAPRKDRAGASRRFWGLAALLAALAVAAAIRWAPNAPSTELDAQLRGDAEEAVGALSAVLDKAPPGRRLPLLLRYANDGSPGLRYAAIDALGDRRGPEAADALERAFKDSSSAVRQRAMEVLPKVDRERGLRLLLAGLADEDRWIREAAVQQIMALTGTRPTAGDRRAVPMLIKSLDDPSKSVSVLAMAALRRLTSHPWKVKVNAQDAKRRAVIGKWKSWWAANSAAYAVPAHYANPVPVRPTRIDQAPDFTITDTDGRPLSLASRRGRIILLNFWGSWCPPCQQEIPDLVRLDQEYRDRNVDIIGIALGERGGAAPLREWCRKHGVRYRQALATDDITEPYGHIEEVPISVLIDDRGRIRRRWEGERDYATFKAAVEQLMSERN